jgi:hypothetical protein
MTFDVSQFELLESATLTVQNAKGDDDLIVDGKPVTIEIYSSGTVQAVKAQHKAGQAQQARMQAMLRGKTDPKAAEKADQEMVDKLTAITKSISPNFQVSPAELYGNPKLGYITRQVAKFADDDANFTPAALAS